MGIMSRPHAAAYEWMTERNERNWRGQARRDLLKGLRGRVLEVGAGTGRNFQYYPSDVTLVATEPNPHMLKQAAPKAKAAHIPIELRSAGAQDLPFDSDTFDGVVATLVFCTVPDQLKALTEVQRVAKGGAPLLMIEHVHASTLAKRLLLNALNPMQRFIFDGCNVNRETGDAVKEAGYSVDEVRELRVEMGIWRYVLIRARVPEKSPAAS